MNFNIFSIQGRAAMYADLTPFERGLLKASWSLVWHAVVTGLLAVLYALYAAFTGGSFDPKNVLIAGGVSALLALEEGVRKFAAASNDPTLEEIAGMVSAAANGIAGRVPQARATYQQAAATAARYVPIPDPYDTRKTSAVPPPATTATAAGAQNQARTLQNPAESFLNDQGPPVGQYWQPTPGVAPSLSTVTRNIPPLPPKQ